MDMGAYEIDRVKICQPPTPNAVGSGHSNPTSIDDELLIDVASRVSKRSSRLLPSAKSVSKSGRSLRDVVSAVQAADTLRIYKYCAETIIG